MSLLDTLANTLDPPLSHLCRQCGQRVRPIVGNKVNGCFFIVLLFFFIIPGILYYVWGASQKVYTCPKCKAQGSVIPLDTPEAQRLGVEQPVSPAPIQAERNERSCPWCAEPILVAAKVCKHCGREVQAPA